METVSDEAHEDQWGVRSFCLCVARMFSLYAANDMTYRLTLAVSTVAAD